MLLNPWLVEKEDMTDRVRVHWGRDLVSLMKMFLYKAEDLSSPGEVHNRDI